MRWQRHIQAQVRSLFLAGGFSGHRQQPFVLKYQPMWLSGTTYASPGLRLRCAGAVCGAVRGTLVARAAMQLKRRSITSRLDELLHYQQRTRSLGTGNAVTQCDRTGLRLGSPENGNNAKDARRFSAHGRKILELGTQRLFV